MTPDRYARVRELHDAVIDLSADARTAFFQRESIDGELIAEVMALITAGGQNSLTTISRPLHAALESANQPAIAPGDVLDVWRIEREIGQGGMGSVYLAERCDGHFQQTAALKLVKGLPRAEALTFFSRERQLLAELSHPNIARLLDGGATPGGQPYLVMEYIDGIPIDRFCRERALGVRQVLALFISACDAVAFAHQQLVVHCDLKPSNLMINRDGRPVLLDFGIARLLDRVEAQSADAGAGAPVENPRTTSVPYTPRYASPEQRERGVVTTVSDIYSLGIMLDELLGAAAAADAELTAIVAKATHADAAKRYPTIEAFAGDIQRYLRQLPVLAMQPSAGYVARKLVQRRWPLLLAGTAFAATVVGFTVKVVIEAERATAAEKTALRERDRAQLAESQALKERDATQVARNEALQERDRAFTAELAAAKERDRSIAAEGLASRSRDAAVASLAAARRERSRAERTAQFLGKVLSAVDPDRARDLDKTLMREVLDQASNAAQRELADEPALLGDITRTIGLTYAALNEHDKALTQLNRALTLLADAPVRERLALRMRIADMKDAMGRSKEALVDCESIYQEALRAFGPLDVDTQRSRQSFADQLNRNGQHQRALSDALSLQPDIEKVLGADSALALDNRLTIAMARSDLGQVDEAVRDYREVLTARTRLYGDFHSKVNAVWLDLAIVYLRNQRFTDAEQLLRPQLPGVLKRFGDTNYVTIQSYALMASALRYGGKLEESGYYYKFAVEQARQRYGAKNGLTLAYEINYANFEVASGRPASALETYNRIEPIVSEQRGAESPDISELRRGRAKALTLLGRRADAIADWQSALVIDRKRGMREDHPRVQEALNAINALESGVTVKVP